MSQEQYDIGLIISGTVQGNVNVVLGNLGNKLNTVEQKSQTASRALSQLAGMLTRDLLMGASRAITESIALGKSLDGLTASFDALSKEAIGGSVSLDDLREATMGTVSDIDLLKQANQAMLLGIPTDAMMEMANASVFLGQAVGGDTLYALESLTTGMGRQSKLMLDNVGITFKAEEAYEQYALSLGKTVDDLSEAEKKTAFMSIAMAAMAEKAATLEGSLDDDAMALNTFTTMITNAKTGVGDFIVDALGPMGSIMVKDVTPAITTLASTTLPMMISSALAGGTSLTAMTVAAKAFGASALGILGPIGLVIGGLEAIARVATDGEHGVVDAAMQGLDVWARVAENIFTPATQEAMQATAELEREAAQAGTVLGDYGVEAMMTGEILADTADVADDYTDSSIRAAQASADAAEAERQHQIEAAALREEYKLVQDEIKKTADQLKEYSSLTRDVYSAERDLDTALSDLGNTISWTSGTVDTLVLSEQDMTWATAEAEQAYYDLSLELEGLQYELTESTNLMAGLKEQMGSNSLASAKLRLKQMELRDEFEDGKITNWEYEKAAKLLEDKMRDLQIESQSLRVDTMELQGTMDDQAESVGIATDKVDALTAADDIAEGAQASLGDAIETLKGFVETATDAIKKMAQEIIDMPSKKTVTITVQEKYKKIIKEQSTYEPEQYRESQRSYVNYGTKPGDEYQHGFEGWVRGPRTMTVGEAGSPEYVTITPRDKMRRRTEQPTKHDSREVGGRYNFELVFPNVRSLDQDFQAITRRIMLELRGER